MVFVSFIIFFSIVFSSRFQPCVPLLFSTHWVVWKHFTTLSQSTVNADRHQANHTPDFQPISNHTPDFQFWPVLLCFALSHLPRNTYKTFRLPGIELKFSPQKWMLAITLQAVSPTTIQNPETIRCKKAPSISFKINKENKKE